MTGNRFDTEGPQSLGAILQNVSRPDDLATGISASLD